MVEIYRDFPLSEKQMDTFNHPFSHGREYAIKFGEYRYFLDYQVFFVTNFPVAKEMAGHIASSF